MARGCRSPPVAAPRPCRLRRGAGRGPGRRNSAVSGGGRVPPGPGRFPPAGAACRFLRASRLVPGGAFDGQDRAGLPHRVGQDRGEQPGAGVEIGNHGSRGCRYPPPCRKSVTAPTSVSGRVAVDLPEPGAGDPVVVARRGFLDPGAAPQLPDFSRVLRIQAATDTSSGSWRGDPAAAAWGWFPPPAPAAPAGGSRWRVPRLRRVRCPAGRCPTGSVRSRRQWPAASPRTGTTWVERWACMPSFPPVVSPRSWPACATRGPCRRRPLRPRPPRRHRSSRPAGVPMPASRLELFVQHLGLEPALPVQADVAELRAAHRRMAVPSRPGRSRRHARSGPPGPGTPRAPPRRRRARTSRCSPASVSRTRTFSPGMPCRTKMTRPSCRATQCPPCATGPTSTTSSSPACAI